MKIFLSILWFAMILCCSGCVTYYGYDGPYEGMVIDKDTNQPIEGVVVHGAWSKAHLSPGGATHTYYDSVEVLTDKEGRFKIRGMGMLILSNTEEMDISIFKAGYTQIKGYWSGFKIDPTLAPFVVWDGNKAIFKLRRMAFEERKNRDVTGPLSEPNNKLKLFNRERNKENIEIGRPSSSLFPEE